MTFTVCDGNATVLAPSALNCCIFYFIKVYDHVWHTSLLQKMLWLSVPLRFLELVMVWLTNRLASVTRKWTMSQGWFSTGLSPACSSLHNNNQLSACLFSTLNACLECMPTTWCLSSEAIIKMRWGPDYSNRLIKWTFENCHTPHTSMSAIAFFITNNAEPTWCQIIMLAGVQPKTNAAPTFLEI